MFQIPTANNDMSGSMFAGAGKWIQDVTAPLLDDFIDVLGNKGFEMKSDHCNELYRKAYEESSHLNTEDITIAFHEHTSAGIATTLSTFVTASTLAFLINLFF
jgi:hypothetical protein